MTELSDHLAAAGMAALLDLNGQTVTRLSDSATLTGMADRPAAPAPDQTMGQEVVVQGTLSWLASETTVLELDQFIALADGTVWRIKSPPVPRAGRYTCSIEYHRTITVAKM